MVLERSSGREINAIFKLHVQWVLVASLLIPFLLYFCCVNLPANLASFKNACKSFLLFIYGILWLFLRVLKYFSCVVYVFFCRLPHTHHLLEIGPDHFVTGLQLLTSIQFYHLLELHSLQVKIFNC